MIWTISWRSLMIAIAWESQQSLDAVAWWCVKFILHRIFHMTPIKSKNGREYIIYNSCRYTIEISDMRYPTNRWLHAYLGHICISIMRKIWVKTYAQNCTNLMQDSTHVWRSPQANESLREAWRFNMERWDFRGKELTSWQRQKGPIVQGGERCRSWNMFKLQFKGANCIFAAVYWKTSAYKLVKLGTCFL